MSAPPSQRRGLPGRALTFLMIAVAFGMLALRFARLDLAPFIRDEPRLQFLAQEQIASGLPATHGIVGTRGVAYGPCAVWLYGAVQAVAGPDPRRGILALGLVLSLAHVALAAGLARLFGGGPALFATLLAFIASSPYQFFWSRTAWDNPLAGALAAMAVAILASPEPFGPLRALLLGLVLGAAISTHLMVLPFAALAMTAATWQAGSDAATPAGEGAAARPRLGVSAAAPGMRMAALAALAVVAVNVPYLAYLAGALPSTEGILGSSARGGPILASLAAHLLQPPRVSSAWGIEYYFGSAWPDFHAWLGRLRPILVHPTLPMAFVAVLSVAGIAVMLRAEEPARRRMALLAASAWLIYPTLFAWNGLDRHPHYQHATWWVVPFGIAGALCWLRRRSPAWARAMQIGVWAVAALQITFIISWTGYVAARAGTRDDRYGTTIGAQQEMIRSVCGLGPGATLVENQTVIHPESLQYIAATDGACSGREVMVCPPGACPSPPGARHVRLRYSGPAGGGVQVE